MKIAVVYNRESQKVINLFGIPNREKYGLKAIKRITDSLKKGKHQAIALEGDKDLIDNLEEFMPRVLKGEQPGMVFNLSYGIQGQARYTHVPSILEMIGIPYVGSGPLAHSLALDKVVAKMMFVQNNLPTPPFAVVTNPDFEMPDLAFPLIVKPKNEAVSLGIKIVNSEQELRDATQVIFDTFSQPVLVESYIEGREINVGILGNNPPMAFEPAEIGFGESGPKIYTYEDKTRTSGREIAVICPAPIEAGIAARAQQIAIEAFTTLGCYDCARVDMRLDSQGNLYILEVNSLPSLGEHGSYVAAAEHMGMDFSALANRLVDVASARYFDTPNPPEVTGRNQPSDKAAFSFLTNRRDQMEKQVQQWCQISSRTYDPIGIQIAHNELDKKLTELGMKQASEYSDDPHVWVWQTPAGLEKGTLLIGQLDIPLDIGISTEPFRRDPECLHGEGVGSSRAPLVMLEYTLKALKFCRQLKHTHLGIMYYADEGNDTRYSAEAISKVAGLAKQVLVLNAGNVEDKIVTKRRGQRKYRLTVEGKSLKLGQSSKTPDIMLWLFRKLEKISRLSSSKERIAIAAVDFHTDSFPMLLPHRITTILQMSFPDIKSANKTEEAIREILKDKSVRWNLAMLSNRPSMKDRRVNARLINSLQSVADQWEIPLGREASLIPSVAGLVPTNIPVVCGIGPVATNIHTSQSAVQRISLVQRTLLLTEFLIKMIEK